MPQLSLPAILAVPVVPDALAIDHARETMPEAVQTFMRDASTTHYESLAQPILYRGAGIEVVWPQFCALLAIGTVAFVGALAASASR
jgi:ABC-2 type transport system permease protein